MFANKTIYALNSAAVGDLVAAAPALKWSIDTYHKKTEYKVAMFPEFRDLFPFVPDENIIPLASTYDGDYSVRKLNMDGSGGNVCRLTPSRMKLTHYACVGLLSRIIPDDKLKFIPLKEVDVSRFNVDFSNAAVFVVTYRDIARSWKSKEIIKTAEYVQSKGLTPVFVGKRGAISIWKTLAQSDFETPSFGVDLTDQTTFLELATIMKKSKVIFAMDSGPLNIAFTTDTPIVAGFTNINPELRIPLRNEGVKTVSVVPNNICRFCQSDWSLDFWNFSKCPKGQEDPDCANEMTADKFINAFDKLQIV